MPSYLICICKFGSDVLMCNLFVVDFWRKKSKFSAAFSENYYSLGGIYEYWKKSVKHR